MLCGEIQRVEVTLKNIGNAPLMNIYIACTDAKLFTLENLDVDKSEGKHFHAINISLRRCFILQFLLLYILYHFK